MKKYFFGYLFVRIAKILAIVIVIIGIAYALVQFEQASIAADSVRYLSSPTLREEVEKLFARSSEAERLVSEFTGNRKLKSQVSVGRVPNEITSMSDFQRLAEQLKTIDRQRQMLKQSVVERFEGLVDEIQKKLRAYAASLSPPQASPPPPAPSPIPTTKTIPITKPASAEPKTLFSDQLTEADIQTRLPSLTRSQQFLKAVPAENPENQVKLSESVMQLESLKTLLPLRPAAALERLSEWPVQEEFLEQDREASIPSPRKILNAEKLADQLDRLRLSVRQAVFSSWALDDAFDGVQNLSASERNKCRSATLAVTGIWLTAFAWMAAGVVGMAFVAFLILVTADLTQTLLDTATNTGVIAEGRAK